MRKALAGAIAIVCAAVIPLVVAVLSSAGPAPRTGLTTASQAVGTQQEAAAVKTLNKLELASRPKGKQFSTSSGELGVKGMSEHQLRRFETQVLGPEHAAEHARMRALLRKQGKSAGATPAHNDAASASSAPDSSSTRTARAAAAPSTDPAVSGRWETPFSIPVMGIHAALMPTGKVLWFAYPKNPNPKYGGDGGTADNSSQAWLYDPGNGSFKQVNPPLLLEPTTGQMKPANIWCGGQVQLANGDLFVMGGNYQYSPPANNWKGLNKAYTFNPFNETWTQQPDMRHGRWYPGAVRMSDGRVPIISGFDESGNIPTQRNTDVELFTPSSDPDGRGTMTLLGNLGGAGQPPTTELYPHLHAMPSGRMLVAGPDNRDSWYLNAPGASNTYSWSDTPNLPDERLWGNSLILPGGTGGSTRVMGIGGSSPGKLDSSTTDPSVATTDIYDESNPTAGFTPGPSMNIGRGHANAVLLPDGSAVEVGGGVGIQNGNQYVADPSQRQVELWDPSTNSWRLGAAQAESRAYHSTALLLPDGRVISAGDDYNGGIDQDTAEIYEPPYLFKGTRPTINSAPANITVGSQFDVDSTGTVQRAVLVAPGATTHADDMNQRVIPLSLTQRSGGVTLTAPPSAEAAPPGYYMLFLVNDQGVPSVAKFVKLADSSSPVTSEDKAAGRATSASSVEATGLESGKAVDNDSSTRWSSIAADNQWWQVDLGSIRKVGRVELNWENAYSNHYKIQTSTDGTTYTDAADVNINGKGLKISSFAARDARYVKVLALTRGTQWGNSFWDAHVYGPDDTNPPPPPPPPPTGDLALNKPATASTVERAGWEANKANDGNSTTRWSSDQIDNQWWQVDLGSVNTIGKVELNWEDAFSSHYKILTSTDGTSYSEAADVNITSPGLQATSFPARDARYVKVQEVTRGTPWGMSFWDARVYAASPPPPPPPPPTSYANTILGTTGLSSYWRLGETSGTSAAAAKGTVNGTYGAGATLGQPGLITGDTDKAPVLNGSSTAKVTFGDVYDFAGTGKFSLEAWVKPSVIDATSRRILSKEWSNGSDQGYILWANNARTTFARLINGAYQSVNGSVLTAGQRYHLVVTYDGATLRMYVNGALNGSAASTGSILNGTSPFALGMKSTGGGNWSGTVDEPAVYDGTVLTAAQVAAHYQAGNGG